MKNKLLLLFLFTLISCNGGGTSSPASAASCPTKDLFSEWSSPDLNLDLTGGYFAVLIHMEVGGNNLCSNGDGDFLVYIEYDGHFELRDCHDHYTIDSGTWDITCGQLTLEYQNAEAETYR